MSKIYWFLGHEQFQPEELIKQAEVVEAAGFDGVMVSEHLQPWVSDTGAAGYALSTLGGIAATTKKLKIMTGVTTPLFRFHPALVAQAAATIDRISNGRFELGIGTGEPINEIPLGYDFPSYNERAERIVEAIEIIKRLLDGEKLTFSGKYYSVDSLKLYSPPIHRIPIILAAGGPKSSQIAAKHCDGIITSVKKLAETKEYVINAVGNTVNWDKFRLIATRWSVYAKNDKDAWKALSAWRGLRAPSRLKSADPEILQNEADHLNQNQVLSRYSRIKEIEDYVSVYGSLITELNADTITIQTTSLNQLETISKVGTKVLPKLRKL